MMAAGRFQFTGEVLAIEQEEVVELRIGDPVLLLAKAFNPILLKIK